MSHLQCFLIFLISVTHTYGQSWSIKGQVVNTQTSNYLIGCSVYNVTKQMGTVTNEEGRFRITVERGDLIQFTYLGMGVQQQYILDDKELLIEMSYQTRRMKPVTIKAEVVAKKSILYNPKYDSRGAVFLEPVRRSAKDYKKMSGIGTSNDANNPGVVMSPISFFYYSNKKVQRRLNALVDINKLDASNQKYTLDFISLVTKVEDIAELKDIKAHCYFPHDEVLNSTFYELGLKLKDCYIDFLEVEKSKPTVDSALREE
jgi:hypothetical protein